MFDEKRSLSNCDDSSIERLGCDWLLLLHALEFAGSDEDLGHLLAGLEQVG
jgi:hypothetical protein